MSKRILTRSLVLALALFLLLAAVGCQAGGAPAQAPEKTPAEQQPKEAEGPAAPAGVEPVKIAVFIALSGNASSAAVFQIQALELAVQQFNENGGVKALGGAPLELVLADNMSDANYMKTVVESTFEDESITFGLLPLASSYTMPAIAAITKSEVPCLTTSQSDAIYEQGCDYIYGIACTSSAQGEMPTVYAKYLKDNYGVDTSKIGVVCVDNEYGASMQATYEKLFGEMEGYDIVYSTLYPVDTTDMSSVVTALKQRDVQLLFSVNLDQDAKLFFNTMKSMNYNPLVIGGGSGIMYPTFYEDAGAAMEGIISVTNSNPTAKNTQDDAEFQALKQRCYDTYGHYGGEFLVTYDTIVDIISQCLEHTGSRDRNVNNKAMKELEFKTLFQKLDANGQVTDIQFFNEKGISPNSIPLMAQFQYDENGDLLPQCIYPLEYASAELQWSNE